jgi:tetratricopeptide (TPR) repeat protein
MFDVGFTPDGKFLATASTDGTARVWEGLTGRPVTPPLRLGAMAWTLEISPEGRWLAVGGVSPRHPGIPVFDLQDLSPDPRVKPDELQSWSELVACQRIHETGNIENLASAEWLARWKACRHLRTEQPSIDWSPQSQADWHDRQALAFESAGDRQAEIWHLDRLVERQPRNPQILRRRGQAYGKVGQQAKAIRDLSTAIDLDPADESAWSSRGQVELDSGQVDAAIADFSKTLELAPEHWVALASRGIARGRKGAAATAVDDLSFALRIFPEGTQFLKERARLYHALGFAKKALADFEQIVEIDPAEPSAHNDLAWFLATALDASLRDPQRAVELAQKAVQLTPGAGGCWNTLGVVQYRRGDWKAAIEALTKSTELQNDGVGNNWFFLAMAYWRVGDKSAARFWYDKAVRWTDKNRPKDEELSRFRGEAAALLEVTEKLR